MTISSKKSPKIETSLDLLTHKMFGRTRTGCIYNDKCISCGGDASDFRDELSRKEYRISGMCQKCQDSIFGE